MAKQVGHSQQANHMLLQLTLTCQERTHQSPQGAQGVQEVQEDSQEEATIPPQEVQTTRIGSYYNPQGNRSERYPPKIRV